MIFFPFLLSGVSFTTCRILDIPMNHPASGTLVPSIDGPLKKGFFFLIRLAWESRIRIPYIIAVAFMALDIRMQLEITVDRAVRQLPDGNDVAAMNLPDGVIYADEDGDEDDEEDDEEAQYDTTVNSSTASTIGDSEVEERINEVDVENVIDTNENTGENNTTANDQTETVGDKTEGEGSKRVDIELTENVDKKGGDNCEKMS